MLLFLIFILRSLNENINTHVLFVFHLAYARDHQPCIIFMDEIDAIGKCNVVIKSSNLTVHQKIKFCLLHISRGMKNPIDQFLCEHIFSFPFTQNCSTIYYFIYFLLLFRLSIASCVRLFIEVQNNFFFFFKVDDDSRKEHRLIVKFNEPSWRYFLEN